MNKLTFKRVWDEAWMAALSRFGDPNHEDVACGTTAYVRDEEFEEWFVRSQLEEI